ncbi:MAG: hypothetical protein PHH28_17160, partial [Desulfuromonadaceae bacterium]|nr:hypothetical protein [Desulfuromonadaceae bacterium]
FIRTIDSERLFETTTFSAEDQSRCDMYRCNTERSIQQEKYADINSFLKSLCMEAIVGSFDAMHLSRISQLINKSNQFHLTTTRYSEAEILQMMHSPNFICRYYKLKDKFGDYGLIGVVILKEGNNNDFIIDTFVLSCRVLSRGMEELINDDLISLARSSGKSSLFGIYIPTNKNKLVSGLYPRLGYQITENTSDTTHWRLDLTVPTTGTVHYITLAD